MSTTIVRTSPVVQDPLSEEAELATLGPAALAALESIRRRVRELAEADPEFAEVLNRPLSDDEPQDEFLDRLRAGEFRE